MSSQDGALERMWSTMVEALRSGWITEDHHEQQLYDLVEAEPRITAPTVASRRQAKHTYRGLDPFEATHPTAPAQSPSSSC